MRTFTLVSFIILALSGVAYGATATTTLQMIWPANMLGIDQEQALEKAVTYLQTVDFAESAAKSIPKDKRDAYAQVTGINNPGNISAIANLLNQNLSVQAEKEHGDISLTFTCEDSQLALEITEIIAKKAVGEARFKIAEKMDPSADAVRQQMENIQDQMQAIQSQIHVINQQRRTPANQHGANIGAPINMGRVVNPQGTQDRLQIESYQTQLKQLRQQYNALNKELTQAVNSAWKGKPKAGLVIIDHADLDA